MAEVVILQGAQADLIRITIRHGERFESGIDSAFEQLSLFPRSAPLYSKEKQIRRILIPRSPLAAFYTIVGERVLMIAVLDLRIDPSRIQERLSE